MTVSQPRLLSVEEYLELEEVSATKHEYIGGELFAMTGTTNRHGLICMNVAGALRSHLRGGPCRAFMSGVKVRLTVDRDEIFYYPDVLVACGPQDLGKTYVRDPKLIVEVLSPSTQRVDRREKALSYRHISSLEQYVLIAQDEPEVTIYARSEDWRARVHARLEAQAALHSVALSLPLTRIYEDAL